MTPPEDEFDLNNEASARPDEDEVLVAYLDGQLDAEQCESIESRLATDAAAREKLQSLDRVWNALDVLPRSTASPTFTRSTVEMAAVSASQKGDTKRRLWKPPVWLLAGGVGALAGLLLTLALAGAPERRALNHLPTLLNASALENVGSIEYLRLLEDRAGDSLRPFRTDEVTSDTDRWNRLAAATVPERREWIAALPPDELTAVNSAADRFSDRSQATRDSLQELSRRLDEEDEPSALRETALAYQAMVGRLSQGEQARLRQMDNQQRLRSVMGRAKSLARDAALDLNDAEREAFRAAIDELVESEAFENQIKSLRRRFPQQSDASRHEPRRVLLDVTGLLADPFRRLRRGGGPESDRMQKAMRARFEEAMRERAQPVIEAWNGWAETLANALPSAARGAVEEAASRGRDDHAKLMHRLLRDALASDLSDAFVSLPEDKMEEALLEPRGRFAEMMSDKSSGAFDINLGPRGGGPPRGFDGRGRGPRPDGRFRDGPPGPPEGRPPFGPGGGPPPRRGD
ncbi:hypothetical protein MalM25_34840 [Planctomycetes bacterium MalM25]|nr:hypothetical protein MalM25_34840 [Planctomycetes bacterium MalM25]